RNVSSVTASTEVWANAAFTSIALVEKSTAPVNVIAKPVSVSVCFCTIKEEKPPDGGSLP
ncbi:MAG: hypothetical protein ICV65_20605, partial [Flavisolibacter sp.]|nr:hypothetical protein [Flavisolibacter sp.]